MTPTPYDPPSLVVIIGAAVIWIVIAIVVGFMAEGRKRDGAVWMMIGLVFGPITIIPVAIFEKPD